MNFGMVLIDQTPCRASYGLYTPDQFLENTTDDAKQAVLENIGQTAANGDRLTQIQNKTNPIPEMAYEASITSVPDVVLQYVARPTFQYIPPNGSNLDTSA